MSLPLTLTDAETVKNALINHVPHVSVALSTLGGAHRASIMITFSLDEKSTWINGIMHNSRYAHVMIDYNLKIENFCGSVKHMRAATCKDLQTAINKIVAWIEKVKGE